MQYIKPFLVTISLATLFSCGNPKVEDNHKTETTEVIPAAATSEDIVRAGTSNGNRYFEDKNGKKLFNGAVFYNAFLFSRGYCIVSKKTGDKELYGVINAKGETVIDFKYEHLDGFYNVAYFKVLDKATGKSGLIDSVGKDVLPAEYTKIESVRNGLVKAEKGYGKNGIVNLKNEIITPFEYSNISYVSNGLIRVNKQKNYKDNYGFIDSLGKPVIECQYPLATDFKQGIALVKKGNKIGFINTKNETVIGFQYDDYQNIVDVSKNQMSSTGYSESNSRFIMEEGYIVLSKNGKWGYIDTKGNEVIPFEYESIALPGSNNNVVVVKEGKRGEFNIETKQVKWYNDSK